MEEGEKLKSDRKGAGGGGDPDLCPVEGPQNVNQSAWNIKLRVVWNEISVLNTAPLRILHSLMNDMLC